MFNLDLPYEQRTTFGKATTLCLTVWEDTVLPTGQRAFCAPNLNVYDITSADTVRHNDIEKRVKAQDDAHQWLAPVAPTGPEAPPNPSPSRHPRRHPNRHPKRPSAVTQNGPQPSPQPSPKTAPSRHSHQPLTFPRHGLTTGGDLTAWPYSRVLQLVTCLPLVPGSCRLTQLSKSTWARVSSFHLFLFPFFFLKVVHLHRGGGTAKPGPASANREREGEELCWRWRWPWRWGRLGGWRSGRESAGGREEIGEGGEFEMEDGQGDRGGGGGWRYARCVPPRVPLGHELEKNGTGSVHGKDAEQGNVEAVSRENSKETASGMEWGTSRRIKQGDSVTNVKKR
jgi:hypothetical protein